MLRALLYMLGLLLSAFCFLPSAYCATWTRQPSGTMAWLHSVYFLDQNCGWVAGSSGTLLRTTDGGATWKKLSTLTQDTLHDVYFADEKVGWLIAEHDILKLKTNDEPRSYLLKTEDGGLTWQHIFVGGADASARLVRMIFADSRRGWVFGETGVVFATRDGGAHWTQQASATKHLLLGGAVFDQAHLWLVGAGATIVQTSDGGARWQVGFVRDGAPVRFSAASFVNPNAGWAVGDAGRIFATIDGGRVWYPQKSNVDADLFAVTFVDGAEGWAVGSQGVLLHTTDAGAHWVIESSGTTHTLQDLFFVDRKHGWAVGFGGTILKYGESTAPKLR